jgi:hypothetical protein
MKWKRPHKWDDNLMYYVNRYRKKQNDSDENFYGYLLTDKENFDNIGKLPLLSFLLLCERVGKNPESILKGEELKNELIRKLQTKAKVYDDIEKIVGVGNVEIFVSKVEDMNNKSKEFSGKIQTSRQGSR